MPVQDVQEIKTRIQRLVDVMVALVIVAMALRIPLLRDRLDSLTWNTLAPSARYLVAFAISFLTVATLWNNNLRLAASVRTPTRSYIWLTALVLFWVALLPAATDLMGRRLDDPAAVAAYGVLMSAISISLTSLRLFTVFEERGNVDLAALHSVTSYKAVAATFVYLGSIPLAFVTTGGALLCFVAPPLMFVLTEPRLQAVIRSRTGQRP